MPSPFQSSEYPVEVDGITPHLADESRNERLAWPVSKWQSQD